METLEKSQGMAEPATTCLGPGDLCDGAGSQGIISVEPVEFIRLIEIEIFPNRGRGLQRDGGTCQECGKKCPSPYSLSLCVSGTPWTCLKFLKCFLKMTRSGAQAWQDGVNQLPRLIPWGEPNTGMVVSVVPAGKISSLEENCIEGLGWLPLAESTAECKFLRAGPQGVGRVGLV